MKSKAPSFASRAFSLVELLVVMAVIAIVAGFAVPAVTTMLKGSQLTQGSQMVADQISLARQSAISRNKSVEVRFFKYGDPESPGENAEDPSTGFFRSLQVFEILDNGVGLPVGPMQRLPVNVIMNESELSTLLDKNERTRITKDKVLASDPEIPGLPKGYGKSYEYATLRFLPDGSTDLPATGTKKSKDSWYILLHGTHESKDSGVSDGEITKLPPNYFILQIDPITGSTRSYRPNIGS